MKKQAKAKLPKVWVAVNQRGTVLSFGMSKTFLTGLFELRDGESIHQYAPVQPPRRCVWTYVSISRTWSTDCGHHDWKAERHCPYCGGRIVRRKS